MFDDSYDHAASRARQRGVALTLRGLRITHPKGKFEILGKVHCKAEGSNTPLSSHAGANIDEIAPSKIVKKSMKISFYNLKMI